VSQQLAEQGLSFSGLSRVLVQRAMPFLERARVLHWSDTAALPRVAGAELEGQLTLSDGAGTEQQVCFRADRVDVVGEGLVLSDYKTGRVISEKVKPDKRVEDFVEKIRRGELLQAAAYAEAAGRLGDRGRYVFLSPRYSQAESQLEFAVESGDDLFGDALRSAAAVLLDARSAGGFVPRLEEKGQEPDQCGYCTVAEACLRGDSGARGRLSQWLDDARLTAPVSPTEHALLDVWDVGRTGSGSLERTSEGGGEG